MAFPKHPVHMKFSHSPVFSRCSNTSVHFYQSEIHWDYSKACDTFIFTLIFANFDSPNYIVNCTCMSKWRYDFLLGRIHCRKMWSRSVFQFIAGILLCIHSHIFPWNSYFSSTFPIKLTTEVIMFHKYTSTDWLKTALLN